MAETSKTADQALAILLKVAEEGPLSIADLARSLSLNRTVVYRLVTTLRLRGFLVQDGRRYAPGAMLLRIAETVAPELRAAARQLMSRLAAEVGETVVMHVADGSDAVVLDTHVDTTHVVRAVQQIGSRHSLRLAASGRALLAFLPDPVVSRTLRNDPDRASVLVELERVRTNGYAISHDELQHGVHGLAVPVFENNDAVASLSIIVPVARAAALTEKLVPLQQTAAAISTALSG